MKKSQLIWLALVVLLVLIVAPVLASQVRSAGGRAHGGRGDDTKLVYCKKQGKMVPASQCPCPRP